MLWRHWEFRKGELKKFPNLIPETNKAALAADCSAVEELFYPLNMTRTSVPDLGKIAEVRKSLTLDWLAVEDRRQRGLVAAFESDVPPPLRMLNTDCISYPRPSSAKVGRLLLELLKNLEGDDTSIIMDQIQVLIRSKLLVETSALEIEPDFEALVKTPNVMMGEPHTTFPRILLMTWMMATDPQTLTRHGWCPIAKVNKYLSLARPTQIAKQMHGLEPMIARARYIMEEFIQKITPLNIYSKRTTKKESYPFASVQVKRPMRTRDIEKETLERIISMTTLTPNTTFKAERLPNLEFRDGNRAIFVTAGVTTFYLCWLLNMLGNMLWITMMFYDL